MRCPKKSFILQLSCAGSGVSSLVVELGGVPGEVARWLNPLRQQNVKLVIVERRSNL